MWDITGQYICIPGSPNVYHYTGGVAREHMLPILIMGKVTILYVSLVTLFFHTGLNWETTKVLCDIYLRLCITLYPLNTTIHPPTCYQSFIQDFLAGRGRPLAMPISTAYAA